MRFFGVHVDRLVMLLGAIEFGIFLTAFSMAELATGQGRAQGPGAMLASAGFLALLLLLPLIAAGAYRSEAYRLSGVMARRLAMGGALGLVLVLLATVLFQRWLGDAVAPPFAVAAIGGALCAAYLARSAGRRMAFLIDLVKTRTVLLGGGQRAAQVVAAAQRHRRARLLGLVPGHAERVATALDRHILAATPVGLADLAGRLHASEIVVAMDDRRGVLPVEELLACRLAGIGVLDAATFLERETGRLDLDSFRPSWLIFSDGFTRGRVAAAAKRAIDVTLALAVLFAVGPLLAGVAVAVRLDSRGPAFYRQQRVGLNGRPFSIVKFRSMVVDAEGDGQARWASRGDARITRVGKVIRLTRIDELPQVLNVLKGEMSFVGPRPERPQFVAQLKDCLPYYDFRHQVRPGLTGWAQINYQYGASVEDSRMKLEFDLYYLKHRSVLLDLATLLQTVRIVLSGDGAH